jgi:hypothetical protein
MAIPISNEIIFTELRSLLNNYMIVLPITLVWDKFRVNKNTLISSSYISIIIEFQNLKFIQLILIHFYSYSYKFHNLTLHIKKVTVKFPQ